MEKKITELSQMIKEANHLVFHTGAGISTSCGIPDFRGPKGVWTLEEKDEKPSFDVTFQSAQPSLTHMVIVQLEKEGYLKFVVSQNVDGLHLKSGYPRYGQLYGNYHVTICQTVIHVNHSNNSFYGNPTQDTIHSLLFNI